MTTTSFAGFDTDAFPGVAELAWLKRNSSFAWCGYYLAPAPCHPDRSWAGQRAALQGQGWGLAPVYVGQQTTGPGACRQQVNGTQGTVDGHDAAALARADGFPAGSTVFLDWEDGSAPDAGTLAYIGAWVAAVAGGGCRPGLYCSHLLASTLVGHIATLAPAAAVCVWAWKVEVDTPHPFAGDIERLQPACPGGCGYPEAALWQFEQNCVLSLPGAPGNGLQVDLSWSAMRDPSAAA